MLENLPKRKTGLKVPENDDLAAEETSAQQANSLFRFEAIEAARDRFGSPMKSYNFTIWSTASLMLVLAVAGLCFLFSARYSRKETVVGVLVPPAGSLRVVATRPGLITHVFVREAQMVMTGSPLVSVSFDAMGGDGQDIGQLLAEATRDEAEAFANQNVAKTESLSQRKLELEAQKAGIVYEYERSSPEIELQEQRVSLAADTVEASRSLFERHLIPSTVMRQREEALIAAHQASDAILKDRQRLKSQMSQVDAQIAATLSEAQSWQAEAAGQRARLAEKSASLARENAGLLVARGTGRVAALQAREGAPVAPGDTLAVVIRDDARLQAELWVPSRAIGFVRAGNPVRLMYDAFPYQRFGVAHGIVTEVGRAPIMPSELPTPIETKEPLYRVVVSLDTQSVSAYGQHWILSPGMQLKADMILDERPFLAWLLDPVLAISKRH